MSPTILFSFSEKSIWSIITQLEEWWKPSTAYSDAPSDQPQLPNNWPVSSHNEHTVPIKRIKKLKY